MSKACRKPNTKPVFSARLFKALENEGREIKCEVTRCRNNNLEIHHIVPVSILPDHSGNNIAVLCREHHALVERFYWQERCKIDLETSTEIKQIALAFKTRSVAPDQVTWFEVKSKKLWERLNSNPVFHDPFWWNSCFCSAKRWAKTVETTREVDPKDAIIEDPWFRKKVRPDLKIVSMI